MFCLDGFHPDDGLNRDDPAPCSKPSVSAYLRLPRIVDCISLNERHDCLGASTPPVRLFEYFPLGLHLTIDCFVLASRCFEQNFSSLVLVTLQQFRSKTRLR